jgi:hypothetical protein
MSCGFGCPVGAAGWAAPGLDAVAGDVAGLCANEEVAITLANRIVINDINIFMEGILPVTSDEWQVTIFEEADISAIKLHA